MFQLKVRYSFEILDFIFVKSFFSSSVYKPIGYNRLQQSDLVFASESNGRNFDSLASSGGEKKYF